MPEISALEVMVLVNEINAKLTGTYVNNVYSLQENQIFKMKGEGGDSWLIVAPSLGCWISNRIAEREKTSNFTSELRKHVNRKRFALVEQVDFDRVYRFIFEDTERLRVYVEVPPPGNIIVTDMNDRIILCLREYITGTRTVREGSIYTPPVQKRRDPRTLSHEEILDFLKREKTFGAAIGKYIALPKKYVNLLAQRIGVSNESETSLIADRVNEIHIQITKIIEEARQSPTPSLMLSEGEREIFCVKVEPAEIYSSISEICDKIYIPTLLESTEKDKIKEELERTISKLKLKAKEMEDEASTLRKLASVVQHTQTIEESKEILKIHKVDLPSYKSNSPASLSSALYDKAKEVEKKRKQVLEAIKKIERRVESRKEEGIKPIPIRKRERRWFEKFRWFFTSEGKLAIGGRDANSNTVLIRRHVEEKDTVYHADIHGSPFFVLKKGIEQSENEILEVAQATVAYSSAWKIGLGAADAFWVYREQVSSSAPSGQYLPKGSFLITGKKNYVRHVLLQLAVGIDKEGKVTAGPETAISKWAVCYAVIEPFKGKNSEVAKKIVSFFKESGVKHDISADDVLISLPAGGSRIIRKKVI
jgi:predicted ribosome quality control (RQC) complex YloA/Tae2 family protein